MIICYHYCGNLHYAEAASVEEFLNNARHVTKQNIDFVFDESADILRRNRHTADTFQLCCQDYGFAESDWHRQFIPTRGVTAGHLCEFTGIVPRNTKYKCTFLDTVTNVSYKTTVAAMQNHLKFDSVT